ncbi:hypothetical protein Poli38472_001897 [Pythium oligandrum]|uniref:Uncharacterized protein n=1 Tax=Pythium oligandrum TaxID=41045 RepID=A0A8K1CTT0_PYTOL|nr:hypothetical protein Poli38472_001897 [Pythium oligandrum]|eukprot:TMW69741.1 hypothetical protein Poli38472_001897 [Pythium oligandrum]
MRMCTELASIPQFLLSCLTTEAIQATATRLGKLGSTCAFTGHPTQGDPLKFVAYALTYEKKLEDYRPVIKVYQIEELSYPTL